MFCSQCGARVDPSSKYCSSCGAKLTPTEEEAASNTASSQTPTQTVQKKRMPLWFKLLSLLAVLALIGVTAGILFTESLVDVIDNQLNALRNDDITKAYYSYTSREFQDATSLDEFKKFVNAYPVLLTNQSAHFTQRSIQKNTGTLKGNLTTPEHKNTPIEYKLIKEDGKWKILSIRLLQPGMIQPPNEAIDVQELIETVKSQLKAIQHNDIQTAYEKYASQEFKEATSLEAFGEFIKKYPILSNHTQVSFHKPVTKNGVSTIAAILKNNQTAAYLKYYLIYEDRTWKIWSMRILSPSEGEQEDAKEEGQAVQASSYHPDLPMTLSHIKLGNQVDQNGVILNPSTHFKPDSGNIFVNVEITNGEKGNVVYLNFQHLDSGSFIPAKATIEENGDTILMSSFSPPAEGWPKGRYKLVITSSKGINQVIDFDIE